MQKKPHPKNKFNVLLKYVFLVIIGIVILVQTLNTLDIGDKSNFSQWIAVAIGIGCVLYGFAKIKLHLQRTKMVKL